MNSWILFSFIAALATSFITIIIRYLNKYGNANYLEFYMLIVLFIIFLFLAIYLEFNPKPFELLGQNIQPYSAIDSKEIEQKTDKIRQYCRILLKKCVSNNPSLLALV